MKKQQRLNKARADGGVSRDVTALAQMPAVNPGNQTPESMASWANAFFGPGVPRQPLQHVEEQPRIFDYMSGINLQIIPRAGFNLIPFWQLRAFADTFEYVRVVIETFKREIRSLEWDITPSNSKDNQDYSKEIEELRAFWRYPDRVNEFDAWLNSVLEDVLVIDAASLFLEMEGSKISAVTQIDGATIRPLLDVRGRVPSAPTPAYSQVIKGVDWLWMNAEQFLYRPFNTAVNSCYGSSPTEFIMTTITTTLRRQMAAMVYWDQTNTPEALVGLPAKWSISDLKDYQEYFDALLAGDYNKLRRIKFFPVDGSNIPVHEFRRPDTGAGATAQDEWALKVCCWAFGLSPSEFGLVNGAGLGGKGFMEGAENALYRFGIGPVIQYLQNLITGIIKRQTKSPLCFKFVNIGPSEDRQSEAALMETQLRNGIIDVNVWRQKAGQEPIDNAEPMMIINNVPVMLSEIFKAPAKVAETTTEAAPASADVAAQAMNGAQVQSLVELVTGVSAGDLATESAFEIIRSAFPAIAESSVRRMIDGAKKAEPPKPAPIPTQLQQPIEPTPPAEEPPVDEAALKLAVGAWREKVVKRVKENKVPECDPPTLAKGHIPADLTQRIKAALSAGSIDAAFDLVKKKPQPKHATHERDAIESGFTKALAKAFASLDLPSIGSEANARSLARGGAFWDTFGETLRPVLLTWITKSAQQGVDEVQNDDLFRIGKMVKAKATVDWELVNDKAVTWATDHTDDLLSELIGNTQTGLGDALSSWIESGEPLDDLIATFTRLIDDPIRAELIASTETTRAFAEGNTKAWAAQGVEGRRWFTAEDEMVCPICGELAGQVAKLGESFDDGSDNPPAHPRCRCYLQPVEVVE